MPDCRLQSQRTGEANCGSWVYGERSGGFGCNFCGTLPLACTGTVGRTCNEKEREIGCVTLSYELYSKERTDASEISWYRCDTETGTGAVLCAVTKGVSRFEAIVSQRLISENISRQSSFPGFLEVWRELPKRL